MKKWQTPSLFCNFFLFLYLFPRFLHTLFVARYFPSLGGGTSYVKSATGVCNLHWLDNLLCIVIMLVRACSKNVINPLCGRPSIVMASRHWNMAVKDLKNVRDLKDVKDLKDGSNKQKFISAYKGLGSDHRFWNELPNSVQRDSESPVTMSPRCHFIGIIWFLIDNLHQSFRKLNYGNQNLWKRKIHYIHLEKLFYHCIATLEPGYRNWIWKQCTTFQYLAFVFL